MADAPEPIPTVRVVHIARFGAEKSPPGLIMAIVMTITVIICVVGNLPVQAMIASVGFCIITTVRACARYIVEAISHG